MADLKENVMVKLRPLFDNGLKVNFSVNFILVIWRPV